VDAFDGAGGPPRGRAFSGCRYCRLRPRRTEGEALECYDSDEPFDGWGAGRGDEVSALEGSFVSEEPAAFDDH